MKKCVFFVKAAIAKSCKKPDRTATENDFLTFYGITVVPREKRIGKGKQIKLLAKNFSFIDK